MRFEAKTSYDMICGRRWDPAPPRSQSPGSSVSRRLSARAHSGYPGHTHRLPWANGGYPVQVAPPGGGFPPPTSGGGFYGLTGATHARTHARTLTHMHTRARTRSLPSAPARTLNTDE